MRALRVAIAAALCGSAIVPAAAATAEQTPSVSQEVTLDGLGVGAQTVYGPHGAVDVAFPPPATHLAITGSFVRVFYAHSPDAGGGSTMLVAVNGQPLLTVPMAPGTADGGVVETRLPTSLLDEQQPNRLQVRFELAGPAATVYGRLDGLTTLHYELAGQPGAQTDLEEYPYSLLASGAHSPALGVVLPAPPQPRDLAAAFRVLADLGRRAASQHVRPHVVTAEQSTWLAAGGVSSLVIGRLDALPAAPAILEGAGWTRPAAGWTAPTGRVLGQDEGLVLAAISPWDHRTPLLLVTGGTAVAVDKAAAALVGGGGALSGPFVVVSDVAAGGPAGLTRNPRISVLSPRDLASFGSGRYRAAVGFAVPAVDPDDAAVMDLTVPALGAAVPAGSVEADVNGSWVGATGLNSAGTVPTQLVASFPGRLLRPGQNSLALEFHISGQAPRSASPDGTFTTAGTDTATAAISVPDPSPGAGDLRLLPYPFLEGGRALQVMVADASDGTLSAAAQAMLALGSRTTEAPPALSAGLARSWDGSGDQNLVVVGSPPGDSALAAIAAQLPVTFGPSGQVEMTGSGVRLTSSVGAVEETRTIDAAGRQVLWLAGTGPDVLLAAAAALYSPTVSGDAAIVDASGRLSGLGSGAGGALGGGPGPSTAQVASLIAALLIVAFVALQLLRPRRAPR